MHEEEYKDEFALDDDETSGKPVDGEDEEVAEDEEEAPEIPTEEDEEMI